MNDGFRREIRDRNSSNQSVNKKICGLKLQNENTGTSYFVNTVLICMYHTC